MIDFENTNAIIGIQLNKEVHLNWWDPHGEADARRWTAQSKKQMLFSSIREISQQGNSLGLSWFAAELILIGTNHRANYSCPET